VLFFFSLLIAVTDIRSDAQFILVVEKDAAFMRLAEDRFYNSYPCIIITGKGQPDVATRLFLKRVSESLNIPVLGLVDADPSGLKIISVYMQGASLCSCFFCCCFFLFLFFLFSFIFYLLSFIFSLSHFLFFVFFVLFYPSPVCPFPFVHSLSTSKCRTGSKNMSYDSASLTTRDIKWLGVRPTDFKKYNIPEECLIPMTPADMRTGELLLQEDFIKQNEAWSQEIRLMLKLKKKAEIQALSVYGFQYLTQVYLPQKIRAADWI